MEDFLVKIPNSIIFFVSSSNWSDWPSVLLEGMVEKLIVDFVFVTVIDEPSIIIGLNISKKKWFLWFRR